MHKFFTAIGLIILGMLGFAVWRAGDLPSPYLDVPSAPEPAYDNDMIATRFSQAVQMRTISWSPTAATEGEAFLEFHNWLQRTYPNVHVTLSRETVNDYSLLYRWEGKDASKTPIGFLGHMDVVPIEPGTEGTWTHPPFDGVIADGFVWGRGSLDDKSTVVLVMEAVEKLTAEGFQPDRDIYLAFGHDEEIGGQRGAVKIAEVLKSRGIKFDWILDEGLTILTGFLDFIEGPLAVVGLAEKGFLTLELVARDTGGHSSTPRADTAVSKLARAVDAVQSNPFPIEIDAADAANLHAIAGEMPFMQRLAAANLWLFGPMVKADMEKVPYTAAQYRTTTAATVFNGGSKENILPQEARALINFRIHPRNSIDEIVARTKKLAGDEIEVSIYATPNNPPAPSDIRGAAYGLITDSLGDAFGPIAVAPSLVVGATDSRFYADVTNETFRFTPVVMSLEQFSGFHGTNERVAIDSLGRSVAFYERMIRRATGGQ